MDTIFMNSENSKTSELHRLLLKLAGKISLNRSDAGKINLKRSDKYAALSNIKNIKKSYKNNKFKLLVPTWNENFDLPDGSYSVSDIQNFFEYILKNMTKRLIILQ